MEYFSLGINLCAGRVAERFKAAASKAVEGLQALREFESHPFRQLRYLSIVIGYSLDLRNGYTVLLPIANN